ncbi:hypothetical protein [Streptomyces africanus]|uniref:hypothetical protein n=1 Tax=Streptomyces africanus TaxID=231024 RepID=UPI000A3C3B71|nr:hypothetical protein [Streptomyces africanus]
MSGLTRHGKCITYTDESGDGIEISAARDKDGRPAVDMTPVMDAGGELVRVALEDVEDFLAAVREKAAEAQAEYGA